MHKLANELKNFALEDKYIRSELSLAWFEYFGKISAEETIIDAAPDAFWYGFLFFRENSHYKMPPYSAAQKFQPENFPTTHSAVLDVLSRDDDKVKSEKTGLSFSPDFSIPEGKFAAGIFLLSGSDILQTDIYRTIMVMEKDRYTSLTDTPEEFIKDYLDNKIPEESGKKPGLVELEDILAALFTAISVKDLAPYDITDKLEELEHPLTLISEIQQEADVFPESASMFLSMVMTAIQNELGVDPREVKPPATEKKAEGASPEAASEMDILFEQMLSQFQDEEQKSFYADFFDFIKEHNNEMKAGTQQEAMALLGKLEKKWRKSPREKLNGMTPEEYLELHPGLEKSHVKTVRRETPKVGRNDPCPCGSGKKYKKCCGRNI